MYSTNLEGKKITPTNRTMYGGVPRRLLVVCPNLHTTHMYVLPTTQLAVGNGKRPR